MTNDEIPNDEGMTNDEIPNDEGMTNSEARMTILLVALVRFPPISFVIGYFVVGYFVIRH